MKSCWGIFAYPCSIWYTSERISGRVAGTRIWTILKTCLIRILDLKMNHDTTMNAIKKIRIVGTCARPVVLLAVLSMMLALPAAAQVEGYYRHPDIHGDRLVFSAEGDLWLAQATGGVATRLTTHAGEESFPVFSPDGKQVAFRASYDGSPDVYVMDASGGAPRRVTWDARGGARPVGWTADGRLLVRGAWTSGLPDVRLALVDPETGNADEIPLSQAAEGSFTADGTLIFARLPRQGSNSRWYKGGTAQKLWLFEQAAARTDQDRGAEATPLTSDYPGTSRQPNVLADGRVYFLTDRQGAMNVWSMRADGSDLVRHTQFEDFDIQELASDGRRLVFRLGADLWTLTPGEEPQKVGIHLVTDIEQSLTDWETEPFDRVSDAALSHDGSTVAVVSRGELFTAPVGKGRWVHVSRDSGVRYRNVVFTADSVHVLALSDRSGELEWWRVRTDGTEPPSQVSRGPAMLRQGATPSPDGRYLAHRNYDDELWLVDLETGRSLRVASAPAGGAVAWTPDSKFLLYSRQLPNLISALFAHDVASGEAQQITSNRFSDTGPVVAPDGRWLYFVSTRTWNSTVGSPWGERAPMPHFEDTAKIYAIPLVAHAAFPFAEPNELRVAEDGGTPEGTQTGKRNRSDRAYRWDLASKVRELPVPAGSWALVGVTENRLLYRDTSDGNLMALDMKHGAEPITLVESGSGFELSGDGKKILVRKGEAFHVIAASASSAPKLDGDNKVHLEDWAFAVDKRAEWNQIYRDMWRLHRDYFWDPGMGGVDWEAMREKYAPLLPRVASREALADLQGMLVSELSLLHSNAGGGDARRGENTAAPAALGGDFERDPDTGGFRLVRRLVHDPDLPEFRSPLSHPDANVDEGSVVLAINGQPAAEAPALGALLLEQAGKQVRLRIRDSRGEERDVVVRAISGRDEFDLRYHEWEYTRRLEADRLSGGSVGYVHLRAMGRSDAGQFTREFYSQLDRHGMIIDVRHNNGGNIDSWILTQLLRRPWAWFKPRSEGVLYPNMQYSFGGHLVILVDERTASDGEAVADGFRRLGLGASIGVRTWGGEVWLSSSNRQVDGGVTRASETGVFADGEWLIEGWGFVPDMVVDNPPHATWHGDDAQLEAAVQHLMDLIEEDPRHWPDPPPWPELVPGSGFPTPTSTGRRTGRRP
ncbi:MAG: protease [Bacteroidetes bacterium CG12_big_fil_rev_8_21_14_0_65_60_17]|nr:MAG: protease [Bacteroidetes bacterium CG12_big_fil_rev_8_21_14_0_65_60_17]